MNESKSFNQWMVDQGFNAIRHANCCRIAYEGGQQSTQAEIDELKTQLNNMEQCYIGMKKERDALQARIENVNQSLGEMVAVSENLHSSWYVLHDAADLCKAEGIDQCVSEINKALRGER